MGAFSLGSCSAWELIPHPWKCKTLSEEISVLIPHAEESVFKTWLFSKEDACKKVFKIDDLAKLCFFFNCNLLLNYDSLKKSLIKKKLEENTELACYMQVLFSLILPVSTNSVSAPNIIRMNF